ncbi:UDP-N-acetylmuramate dehydrogenase [Tannockella kyphosi]|uniref:UDP-N-acetylmuramate dehydrogenase n=1 Tax=Tannockella kyphosi TaxID=2899121 RepID=UPI0020110D80|nr:UDP-N-acetylmuramate dehydrogenase [Tannockella kyphosi]
MDFLSVKNEFDKQEVGDVLVNESMGKHTSFKAGGIASLYIEIKDKAGLAYVLAYCKMHHIPYFIVGKGSNILFGDKLYEGVVLSLQRYFSYYEIVDTTITCGAGMSQIPLAYHAQNAGLSGFEFMSGIPGTVGGAIYMNAGAYKYDMASVVKRVSYLDEQGNIVEKENQELDFSYRHSIFQNHPEWTILEVCFNLTKKDATEIKEVVEKRKKRRMETQPWDKPSAGSIFRNPDEKGAWYYIDACGLRGYRIGGASVSLKHSNFIVNDKKGTASDIRALISYVQRMVKEKFDVDLHTEVCFVNWE